MLVLLSEPRLDLVWDIGMLSNDRCLRFGLYLVWPLKSIFHFQIFDTIIIIEKRWKISVCDHTLLQSLRMTTALLDDSEVSFVGVKDSPARICDTNWVTLLENHVWSQYLFSRRGDEPRCENLFEPVPESRRSPLAWQADALTLKQFSMKLHTSLQ